MGAEPSPNDLFPGLDGWNVHPKVLKIDPPDIVLRGDWGAVDPKDEEVLSIPVSDVMFTHTISDGCFSRTACEKLLQAIQKRDMEERGMPDIQHNFLVGGDGVVYEGRGFHVNATKDPRHADLEGKSLDIAYIGDFTNSHPSPIVTSAACRLLKYLLEHAFITEEFTITPLGLSQVPETEAEFLKQREALVETYPLVRTNKLEESEM